VRLAPLHFTPDGTKLISLGFESSALHIFDLRAIQEQLVKLGLDWEQPPYPPVMPVNSAPLGIQVVLDEVPKK
jgi:hypothetical protein